MKLERGYFSIRSLAFGRGTSLADGVLTVDRDELVKTVLAEDKNGHIASLEPEIVVPGEDARIVHVLDTLAVGRQGERRGRVHARPPLGPDDRGQRHDAPVRQPRRDGVRRAAVGGEVAPCCTRGTPSSTWSARRRATRRSRRPSTSCCA